MTISRVVTVRDDAPELAVDAWLELDGASPDALLFERGALLAYAETHPNDFRVASVWDDDERQLLGVSVGYLYDASGNGRPARTLNHPGSLDPGRLTRGMWVRRGADAAAVVQALLEAWQAQCRSDGISRLSLVNVPADCEPVRQGALAAGGRETPLPQFEHRIALPPGTTWEGYLDSLGSKWRNELRKDLRRPEQAGARVISAEPTPELMDRLWPLQLDYYARRQAKMVTSPGANLFARLYARVPASVQVLLCLRDETLLGFVLSLRAGTASQFAYVGHIEDPLQIYVSMVAKLLERDISSGVTDIFLGFLAETYKKRLGARQDPSVFYYFPVR